MIEAGVQVGLAAAESVEEARQHVLAVRRVHDLGVKLHPVDARARSSNAATGAVAEAASTAKPGGAAVTVSRCTSSTSARRGRPGEQRAGLVTRSAARPNSADLGALDQAAERVRQQLQAVADAEDRDAELEQGGSSAGAPSA